MAIFLIASLCSCGSGKKASFGEQSLPNSNGMGVIMNYLSADELMGRDTGSNGIDQAAAYIEDYFRANRVPPYFTSYRDTLSNYQADAYNIVGFVEGNHPVLKNQFILIGAHYDHIGVVPAQSTDSIANGANDNASGTVMVMELARYFGHRKTNGRSLIFALFSAEEKGLLGSHHLAGKLKEQQLPLYVMLNFEMTGVPLVDKDYEMYVTGYEKSNLAEVCNKYSGENLIGFLPTAGEFGLFQRSDNYPFHLEFGVPAQTFCTFDFTNFDQYHKVGDEVALLNLEYMAGLLNKLIPVVEGISNSEEKEITYH